MYWFYTVQCLLGFLFCLAQALPSSSVAENSERALERRIIPPKETSPRTVDMHLYFNYKEHQTGPDGKISFPWHTAVEIGPGGKDDPNVFIDILDDGEGNWVFAAKIGKPLQDELPAKGDSPGSKRFRMTTTTKMTNWAIINDPAGPMMKAVTDDPQYRTGPKFKGRYNTCHNFASRMLQHMGVEVSNDVNDFMGRYDKSPIYQDKEGQVKRIERYVPNPDPKRPRPVLDEKFDVVCKKRDGACSMSAGEKDPNADYDKYKNELITLKDQSNLTPDDLRASAIFDPPPDTKGVAMSNIDGDKGVNVGLARAGGLLKSFTMVGKAALVGTAAAGAILGPIFVILDFVAGDWKGGIIGAVGVVAGAIVAFAVTGPLGWLIGGALAALFAILPGLFQKQIDPADRTDIQGILQWKFFGDPKHTGNEQCVKGTNDVPGNKDCQALYGSGAISAGLGLNNFDSIVFLEQFNNGYPMTIPDMAKNFYVVDELKKGDGADKMATITCHNNKGSPAGRAGIIGADPHKWCNKPEFAINRQLYHLVNIGDTADKVFNRIISDTNKNGDCKLVAYPGSQYVQTFNVTLTGLPSGIACGLDKLVSLDGTEVPVNGDKPGGTDGSQSTDSQGGAYVKAPPPAPFKPLAQKDYGCVWQAGKSDPFCMAPGTYAKQSGLGFESKGIDSLSLPSGWSLHVHYQENQPYRSPRPGAIVDHTYTTNQGPGEDKNKLLDYTTDWKLIDTNNGGVASFQFLAPNDGPDPVCCLFTEVKFGGDAWCAGVGGGDILPQWKDKPQSVSCHNGGQVWIYADHYNDEGGAHITGNVEDLKDEPYGTKDSFSKNVKALWVSGGT